MRIGVIGGHGHLGSIIVERINGKNGCCGDNTAVAVGPNQNPKHFHHVELWVIAVPPQKMESLLGTWSGDAKAPIITFAAGLPLSYYHSYGCTDVVRATTGH